MTYPNLDMHKILILKILIFASLSLNAQADERIDAACNHFANVGALGYELKDKYKTQEHFYKVIEKQKTLTRKSLEIGYLAQDKETAFTDAFSNCLNYKD